MKKQTFRLLTIFILSFLSTLTQGIMLFYYAVIYFFTKFDVSPMSFKEIVLKYTLPITVIALPSIILIIIFRLCLSKYKHKFMDSELRKSTTVIHVINIINIIVSLAFAIELLYFYICFCF